MTNYERELILKCYNGNEKCLPILHTLNQFKFAINIYEYLLKKGITGSNLVEYYYKLGCSPLKFGKTIIDRINIENRKMNIRDLKI